MEAPASIPSRTSTYANVPTAFRGQIAKWLTMFAPQRRVSTAVLVPLWRTMSADRSTALARPDGLETPAKSVRGPSNFAFFIFTSLS